MENQVKMADDWPGRTADLEAARSTATGLSQGEITSAVRFITGHEEPPVSLKATVGENRSTGGRIKEVTANRCSLQPAIDSGELVTGEATGLKLAKEQDTLRKPAVECCGMHKCGSGAKRQSAWRPVQPCGMPVSRLRAWFHEKWSSLGV